MNPSRIILILPCCIGDVVLATATLAALRRGYPAAHITWAVGSWSKAVVEHHPLLNDILDTGEGASPVETPPAILKFANRLRAGKYDLVVSLVRSPKMSAAVALSGIPNRAGLDSSGRGWGYNIKAKIDPDQPRHEAEIYLDVPRVLGLDVSGLYANVPVPEADRANVQAMLKSEGVSRRYIVVNPAGGRNPGMTFDAKRYPPEKLAVLAARLAQTHRAQIVLIGGKQDQPLLEATASNLPSPPAAQFAGTLSFGEIAALAADAFLYTGNDTGLTHLSAAAGGKTVMIMGPTDPRRYAPFAQQAIALWKPAQVSSRGVSSGVLENWDWDRDGISVDDAEAQIEAFLGRHGN